MGDKEPGRPTGRGRRWKLRVAVVVMLLAAGTGGGALLLTADGPDRGALRTGDGGERSSDRRDPRALAALRAVQTSIDPAPSFRLRFEGVDTTLPSYGGQSTGAFSGDGEWDADRWRIVRRDDSGAVETLLVGEGLFGRWAEQAEHLATTPWEDWGRGEDDAIPRDEVLYEMSTSLEETEDEGELDEATVDWLAVALAAEVYLGQPGDNVDWVDLEVMGFNFPRDPTGVLQIIEQSRNPTILRGTLGLDDVVTLGTTLQAPPDVVEAFGRPVPDGEVEIDVGPADHPAAVRLEIAAGDESFAIEVSFDWVSPVEITTPATYQ